MNAGTARISVIIPAFNRAALIGETLRSVFCQSVKPAEVIVVDDGSKDDTARVAQEFDSRVRVIRQQNKGAGAARNRGLAEARGDFIHFMDSDDLSSLNTYEHQLSALRNSIADVAYGPWVKAEISADKRCKTQPVVIQQSPVPTSVPIHEWILRGWITVFQPCLFRRTILDAAGKYREDLKPSEDTEYLFRIASLGAKFVHTAETLLVYRVHPEQVSVVDHVGRQRDWLRLLSLLEVACQKDASISKNTRRFFAFRKYIALKNALASLGNSETRSHETDATPIYQRVKYLVWDCVERLQWRIRRRKYGENYPPAFAVDFVKDSHKDLIKQLGYEHVGFY